MKSYLIGTVLFIVVVIPILGAGGLAFLSAVAKEVDNRTETRLRQQLAIDKRHLLKMPELHRRTRTRECQLSDTEIRCVTYPGGVQTIAVAQ